MKIAFRTDASLQIGTGHVMRCLTLADALSAAGAECQFICRAHEANLIEFIRGKGYVTYALPIAAADGAHSTVVGADASGPNLAHSQWLGATQMQDAEACSEILAAIRPNLLIVDHYALDVRWERALAPYYRHLMVIDDLADRSHDCDLLLDQTFGRKETDYRTFVPSNCRLLCGAQYALLRPEFASLRTYSLQRRAQPALRELLITMGGVDQNNATGQVLQALHNSQLPADCRITVVMGETAPWLENIQQQVRGLFWPTRVLVGVSNMAQLMADSDLAIGAAGATSWERCCLGVPTIMLILADNQRKIAEGLSAANAAKLVDISRLKSGPLITPACVALQTIAAMSIAAAAITDGLGATQVVKSVFDKVQYAS